MIFVSPWGPPVGAMLTAASEGVTMLVEVQARRRPDERPSEAELQSIARAEFQNQLCGGLPVSLGGEPEDQVKILLFGSLREDIAGEVAEEVPEEGCSIGVLRGMLVARDPSHAPLARPSVLACVDQEIVRDDHVVLPGQEVAFFRPVSGG